MAVCERRKSRLAILVAAVGAVAAMIASSDALSRFVQPPCLTAAEASAIIIARSLIELDAAATSCCQQHRLQECYSRLDKIDGSKIEALQLQYLRRAEAAYKKTHPEDAMRRYLLDYVQYLRRYEPPMMKPILTDGQCSEAANLLWEISRNPDAAAQLVNDSMVQIVIASGPSCDRAIMDGVIEGVSSIFKWLKRLLSEAF